MDGVGPRADKYHAGIDHGLGEAGVFGEKTVSGMDCLGCGLAGRLEAACTRGPGDQQRRSDQPAQEKRRQRQGRNGAAAVRRIEGEEDRAHAPLF